MKIILQRVKNASVEFQEKEISEIKNGYVLLVGIDKEDNEEIIIKMIKKILKIKLFDKWTRNIIYMDYEILILSQFTLFAEFKGSKPDFHKACKNEIAKELFKLFIKKFEELYNPEKIKTGIFGEYLFINLTNDGPVTIIL